MIREIDLPTTEVPSARPHQQRRAIADGNSPTSPRRTCDRPMVAAKAHAASATHRDAEALLSDWPAAGQATFQRWAACAAESIV